MISGNRVLQGRDDLRDDYLWVFLLPGNAVSYKVYVRLTTGNEAGTVTRPL